MTTTADRTPSRARLARLALAVTAGLSVQSAVAVNILYPGDEAVIEDAVLAGEQVMLSPGVYYFASGWRLTEPGYVNGAGKGVSVLVFEEPASAAAITWAGEGELILKHLSIELAPGPAGADVVRVESGVLELEDVEISGGRASVEQEGSLGAGLRLLESAEANMVSGVVARNASFGVIAEGRSALQISFSRIGSNALGGLLATDGSSVSVVDSDIVRNTGDLAVGVATDGHGWVTVLRTRITGNSRGIASNWYSAVTGVDLSITDSAAGGVSVFDNGWVNLRGSTIARNGSIGLYVLHHGKLAVQDSLVEHNVGYGLWTSDDATLTIVGSVMNDNGADGIAVTRRTRGAVMDSSFARNGGAGFSCHDSSSVSFIRNQAHDNDGAGFAFGTQASCTQHYSTFGGNLAD